MEPFERMYNHSASGDPQVAPPLIPVPEAVASDTAPARDEVAEAVRLLQNNKAAGVDGDSHGMETDIVISAPKEGDGCDCKSISEQACFLSQERCPQESFKQGWRTNLNAPPKKSNSAFGKLLLWSDFRS